MNEQLNQIRKRIDTLDTALILHILEFQRSLSLLCFKSQSDFDDLIDIFFKSLGSFELNEQEHKLFAQIFQILSQDLLLDETVDQSFFTQIHITMLTQAQKNIFFTIRQRNACALIVKHIKKDTPIPTIDNDRKTTMMQMRKNLCENQLKWEGIKNIFELLHDYSVFIQSRNDDQCD